jgi:hypothetical protein
MFLSGGSLRQERTLLYHYSVDSNAWTPIDTAGWGDNISFGFNFLRHSFDGIRKASTLILGGGICKDFVTF